MSAPTTRAEELVRRKDELERELRTIEDWRREIRLGRSLRVIYDPRPMFGFLSERGFMVPGVVQTEFYAFLNQRLDERHTSLREIEAELASMGKEDS